MDFCECTENCKSKLHGDGIGSVLTKRNVSDAELCAYLKQFCYNCECVRDNEGRIALHIAASLGRTGVVRWLLRRKQININLRDRESGYTSLHRSIYHGKIHSAIALLQAGATNLLDNEGLTFIDHAMKNVPFEVKGESSGYVHVWGTNVNYIFGTQQARSVPELWETFHKDFSVDLIKQISLEKFHCVMVSSTGNVFSSGHGQGGRLGLGSEQTALKPCQIKFDDKQLQMPIKCISAGVARDHSIFLTHCDGRTQVWSCGLNTHCVLGLNPPPQLQLSPKRISSIKSTTIGVRVSRYHSVAWNDKTLFTWGLHAGQLGHDISPEKYVVSPKVTTKLKVKSDIQDVVTSSGATVVLTKSGDLVIFHEYQCKIVPSKQQLVGVAVIGGRLNTSLDTGLLAEKNSELKIAVLTLHGKILLWQETDPYLTQCVLSLSREVISTQIVLTATGVLFIDDEGESFIGTIKLRRKRPELTSNAKNNAFHKFLERDECHHIKVSKLQHVHRALAVTSDPRGANFAVIQADPKLNLLFPDIDSGSLESDFKTLLGESDVDDYVHDIQFEVGHQTFVAHKYVLANNSNMIDKYINHANNIDHVHPDIFRELLSWMYTGTCILSEVGECPANLLTINGKENGKNAVRLLQDVAKEFCVTQLEKRLSKLTINGSRIEFGKSKSGDPCSFRKAYNRMDFTELYDVSVIAKNGQVLPAHKCVLVARIDFFQKVYSNRWNAQPPSGRIQLPFTFAVLELFLEYIYTDDIRSSKALDADTLYHLLELSDQYLIQRLRNLCELRLCYILSFKNAVQLLAISAVFNAENLRKCAMTFICSNLAVFLESKALENLDDELLMELTDFYCSTVKVMQNRVITPYSTAPEDEEVKRIAELFPVSMSDSIDVDVKKSTTKSHRSRIRLHKDSISEGKTDELTNDKVDRLNVSNLSASSVEGEVQENKLGIPTRIRAITNAQQRIAQEKNEDNFVRLSISPKDSRNPDSSWHDDFPTLSNSKPRESIPSVKIQRQNSTDKHRMPKLTQRQRKASENSAKEIEVKSECPKNPWKINELPTTAEKLSTNAESLNMGEILTEQKQQKEKFNKMISKPLIYTQLEDKAIEELQKFYNCSNLFEEVITMERVYDIASVSYPTWINKIK